MRRLVLLRLAGLAVLALLTWVALALGGCAGPRPRVEEVSLTPPAERGAPYRVTAQVRNAGHGRGEVKVVLRLRSAAGEHYSEEKEVRLEGGATEQVVAEIPAPPGEYVAEAEVHYPPD